MPEPTRFPPAKRLRLTSEPEQLPPDVAKPHSTHLDPMGDEGPMPASRAGNFDIKGFLLDFIQTDAGAEQLANAFKDRHIRSVLKQHGLNVNATDDVGYSSLPLELRDQIRDYVIADHELYERRCKNCPKLSSYACIDAEWRSAIEAITFRSLRMGDRSQGCKQDLDLFGQCLVGNRPQYLKRISLPCTMSMTGLDHIFRAHQEPGISTDSIRRLFESMAHWQETDLPAGNIHLELERLSILDSRYTIYTDGALDELEELPSVPCITRLSLGDQTQMPFQVLMVLLLSLPRLRRLTIGISDINFKPLKRKEQHADHLDPDRAAGVHLFFSDLFHAAPSLNALEISMDMANIDFPIAEHRNAVILYSQKLKKLSLTDTSHAAILDCLSPFRAENFDRETSPVLSWPNLTHLSIDMCVDNEPGDVERIKESILILGRAVRHMPVIQSLWVSTSFSWTTPSVEKGTDSIFFKLEVFWDDTLDGLRATFSISPDWLDSDGLGMIPLFVTRAVASEEMEELWRESLLKGANAVLEFHVENEEVLDGDDPENEDPDEDDLEDDDLEERDSDEDEYA